MWIEWMWLANVKAICFTYFQIDNFIKWGHTNHSIFPRSCHMLDKDQCILKIKMIFFLDDRCPYHMSSIYPNIAKTFKTGPCWTNEPKDERTDIADPTAPSLCAKEERENKLWFTCLIPLRWVLIPLSLPSLPLLHFLYIRHWNRMH